MKASTTSMGWATWLRWLLVSFIALITGLVVFILVGSSLGEAIDQAPPFVFGLVLGAIFGSAFGIAHWFFLRRFLPGITAWIRATMIGFTFAAAIIFGLLEGDGSESSLFLRIIHAVLIGLSLGFAQWLVLRNRLAQTAYLWILFSLGAWVIGELTGIALEGLAEPPLPLMAIFMVGASLPGIGMVWLLQQAPQVAEPCYLPD